MREATEDERARIGYEEKAARRQQDVDTAALTEECNTAFRNEENA